LVRGRVVRLMLIQIQQLKAGLLKAMGSIDDLVDKNRLNVQLLASIPAFILVTYGSKLLFSFIVGLRMKRVTVLPIKNLQGEMTDCLRRMERCLLLSGSESDKNKLGDSDEADSLSNDEEGGKTAKDMAEDLEISDIATSKSTISQLSTDELGEFVLLCYSYLLLLDYATPPISYRTFDSVHRNIQELLLPHGQLSIGRQLKLLALIKAKNADLLKNV
jgi:nuclear-control-of-ATPase protein 2